MENIEDSFFGNQLDIPNSEEQIENNAESGEITEAKKEKWRELLRQIPVAVNNFYGDPVL